MRKYRLWLSTRSAITAIPMCLIMVWALSSVPLAPFYLFSAIIFIYPFVLLTTASTTGVVPSLLCLLIMTGGTYRLLGGETALASAAYLTPLLLCMLICLQLKLSWQKTILTLLGVFVLSVMFIYLVMQRRADSDLFSLIAQRVIDGIENMPERDSLLNTFYQFGLLGLPQEVAAQPLVEAAQGWTYSPLALQEFYKQIASRVDLWLRALLPTLISSYSLFICIPGFFAAQFYGLRHAQRLAFRRGAGVQAEEFCPRLEMPGFSNLFMPKAAGQALLILALGYLLARLSGNATLALAGQMMYNVFAALYVIQGLSYINFMQKKRNTKPGFRAFTLVALFVLLQPALVFAGLIDQFMDPRKLRRPDQNADKGENT
jgi:hypothetical protein